MHTTILILLISTKLKWFSYENGDVVVDGRVVARNARSSGRLFSGYNDGPGNSSFVAGGHTFTRKP